MKLHTLYTITAITLMFFGVGCLLVPEAVFSFYGVILDPAGIMLAHLSGAGIIALGVLAWKSRKITDPAALRANATAIFWFFVIKTAVTLLAQSGGVFNAMGWSIAVLDGLFLLAYANALFLRRSTTA
ncbi:MAG: hypothetical protein AAB393_10350 [Bacteroidota bacterium]